MFNKILSKAINRYLCAFIEDIDSNQLEFGLFTGLVSIKNVTLRQSLLSKLLKGAITHSTIEELKVSIPWLGITHNKIKVHVRGLKINIKNTFQIQQSLSNSTELDINILKRMSIVIEDI